MANPSRGWLPSVYPQISGLEFDGKAGRGDFKSQGRSKITLLSKLDKNTDDLAADPPHFSIDCDQEGAMWQHVNMDTAAYALGKVSDMQAGINITVMLLGIKKSSGRYWNDERVDRLAWLLWKITSSKAILSLGFPTPFPFRCTIQTINDWKQTWETFRDTSGIVGICHDPNNPNRWGPGLIPPDYLAALKDRMKIHADADGEANGGSNGPPDTGGGSIVEEGWDEGESSVEYTETPMTGKVLRFNPSAHRLSMPVRVDFSSGDPAGFLSGSYKDEATLAKGEASTENLPNLRLGRIIQHDTAAGLAALNEQRYGFRFLYNPTSVSISATRNTSVRTDPQTAISAVISGINQNFQVINFKVFLNRVADVMGGNTEDDYYAGIWGPEDIEGIRRLGTHWDLEYLYRICNGAWNMEDRGETSDIGVLIPANARLILSKGQHFFGFIESVSWQDQLFSTNMVPTITTVDITFRRHFDMSPDSLREYQDLINASGLTGEEDEGGGSSSSSDDSSGSAELGNAHYVNRAWWNNNFPGWERVTNGGGSYWTPPTDKPKTDQNHWVAAHSITRLEKDLRAKYPKWAGNAGIVGDVSHYSSYSDHNPVGRYNGPKYGTKDCVHAIDILIDGIDVQHVMNVFKNDPRVLLYIHKGGIYSRVRGFRYKKYTGSDPHNSHIHLSLRSDYQEIAVAVEHDASSWDL